METVLKLRYTDNVTWRYSLKNYYVVFFGVIKSNSKKSVLDLLSAELKSKDLFQNISEY